MTWTVATARARLGLAEDSTQDAALQAAMDVALGTAEAYCDRWFLLADELEDYRGPLHPVLTVRRYPLVSLTSVQPLPPAVGIAQPVPPGWWMDARRGIVYTAGQAPAVVEAVGSTPAPAAGPWQGFSLAYRGGYDPEELPPALEDALWLIFDRVWALTPGWGAAAGSGGAQPVKQFAIDGMSITYGEAGSAGRSSASVQPSPWGDRMPAAAVGVLDFYRAESAALGG